MTTGRAEGLEGLEKYSKKFDKVIDAQIQKRTDIKNSQKRASHGDGHPRPHQTSSMSLHLKTAPARGFGNSIKLVLYCFIFAAKPLRVEELADMAGMGVSTLHHHFRALTVESASVSQADPPASGPRTDAHGRSGRLKRRN